MMASVPAPGAADVAMRFILGVLGGTFVAVGVGFAFGSTAGWFCFVLAAPILGVVTARWGYGLWKVLGEILSLP